MSYNSDIKKKILFVHDHKFRKIDNKYYSIGGLTDKSLARYTNVFGEIVVFARVIDESKTKEKYSEIKNKKVDIINGIETTNKKFESLVKNCDRVIARLPSFFGLKAIKVAKKTIYLIL